MCARVRMIRLAAAAGPRWEIATQVGCSIDTVHKGCDRFTAEGVLGLFDRARSGAPRLHPLEEVLTVIEVAASRPEALGLPFPTWTSGGQGSRGRR